MRFLKILATAALVMMPALVAAVPAEALTAKQYEHQGRGTYLNSTGSRASRGMYRYHRPHYRHTRMHRHSR